MGLSNYVPNSRLAQPGVCTSTTRPATPYEGQVIYETDTNRVLVWDASAWVMIADTDQPPGLQLVGSNSFTNTANVDVTSCFSSDYDHYRVMFSAVSTHSSASDVNLRVLSGTNTPETGSVYDRWGFSWSTSATNRVSSDQTAIGFGDISNVANTRMVVAFDILHPNQSLETHILPYAWGSNNGNVFFMASRIETTTAYTGLRFYATAGNMTGAVRVYGYRN